MGVVGSGRELPTVEAQFVAELGLLACVEVREGMDFSVDSPEEATKGLWNGYSWQGQQFFAALSCVLGAHQICDPARWILRREV